MNGWNLPIAKGCNLTQQQATEYATTGTRKQL